jgi:hypothetical protein
MTTTNPLSDIVPFGKYKGHPIDTLIKDKPYVEWLMTQPYFISGRYRNVYNAVMRRGVIDPKTPVHNAMQVRFLDRVFLYKLALYVSRYTRRKVEPSVSEILEPGMWATPSMCERSIKLKDKDLGFSGIALTDESEFEKDNWDVILNLKLSYVLEEIDEITRHFFDFYDMHVYIELKPTIGDDYPAVLRQLERRLKNMNVTKVPNVWVLCDSFNGTSCNWEQVREMFLRSGYELGSFQFLISTLNEFNVYDDRIPCMLTSNGSCENY